MENGHLSNCLGLFRNRKPGNYEEIELDIKKYPLELDIIRNCAGCCIAYLIGSRKYGLKQSTTGDDIVRYGDNIDIPKKRATLKLSGMG